MEVFTSNRGQNTARYLLETYDSTSSPKYDDIKHDDDDDIDDV